MVLSAMPDTPSPPYTRLFLLPGQSVRRIFKPSVRGTAVDDQPDDEAENNEGDQETQCQPERFLPVAPPRCWLLRPVAPAGKLHGARVVNSAFITAAVW